jgi:hypothetical protein
LNPLKCGLNVPQLGGFVFVDGEFGLSLGTDLGARLKAVVKVLGGHVGARDQTTALLGDALQELSALS